MKGDILMDRDPDVLLTSVMQSLEPALSRVQPAYRHGGGAVVPASGDRKVEGLKDAALDAVGKPHQAAPEGEPLSGR